MGERHLQINASRLLVRHLDVNGKQIHAMEKQTPSLPGTDPHSDRPRCGERESKFLAVSSSNS